MNSRHSNTASTFSGGSIASQAEVSRLSKVILSIPGCLLKIPWECVSRIKGHSDSLPNLNKEKKKSFFYSRDEQSVTDIDVE